MSADKVLALETGLFGDTETVRLAMAEMPDCRVVSLDPAAMSAADWDNLLGDIMVADKIITI